MIHLDTNFLIQISVAGSGAHAQFVVWISDQEALNVSTIAWADLRSQTRANPIRFTTAASLRTNGDRAQARLLECGGPRRCRRVG